jgi:hypothetical protein
LSGNFLCYAQGESRGRFLRISEEVGDKRNFIIIPATGLIDFKRVLGEMLKVDNEMSPKTNSPVTQ